MTYTKQIAKIESVKLGYEDHGIFTAMAMVNYGGSAQGIGGYFLDKPGKDEHGKSRREGTAYGMEWIIRFMRACGVGDWSSLPGRTIIVLKEGGEWNGKVVGVEPLPTEKGTRFLFADLVPDE